MSSEPLVSVIIPVYNAGAFLQEALTSILTQTYRHLEVLVIDDGSTDGCVDSIKPVRDERVLIYRQTNQGKAVALNFALERIRGEFYLLQDADDVSKPTRIEDLLLAMSQHGELGAVFSGYDIILNDHLVAPRFATKNVAECRRDIDTLVMPSHDPTAMYRVDKVRGIRYDPTLRAAIGYDYVLRVGELFPMIVVGKCLYSYRYNPDSLTHQNIERRIDMVRRVRRSACDRRGLTSDRAELPPRGLCRSPHRDADNGLVSHFIESVFDLRRVGRWREAFETALTCARLHPWDPYYYKPALYSVTPMRVIEFYRRAKSKSHG